MSESFLWPHRSLVKERRVKSQVCFFLRFVYVGSAAEGQKTREILQQNTVLG